MLVEAAAWPPREGLMPGEVKNASSQPCVLEPGWSGERDWLSAGDRQRRARAAVLV
jgi:hypothetical protein